VGVELLLVLVFFTLFVVGFGGGGVFFVVGFFLFGVAFLGLLFGGLVVVVVVSLDMH
jgi:hypothetical protein